MYRKKTYSCDEKEDINIELFYKNIETNDQIIKLQMMLYVKEQMENTRKENERNIQINTMNDNIKSIGKQVGDVKDFLMK